MLLDLKGFSTSVQNANRSLNRIGKNMQRVGSTLTVGLTAPLAAFGAVALKNFDKQAKAIAQVNQGLKTTGGLVGFTTEQLQAQASALQSNSLFGDEVILKDATAQLLTFTNIAGEQFSRTQLAALDLATRLDGDLKSASIQLGKALNDPIANLSALSRSGIQFSAAQKSTIKALAETNRLADAQTIILDELEKQYGGSAKAAAEAGLGPLTQLKNILGDITEDFGGIILEGIKPFIASVKEIAVGFQNVSPETKKFIVIVGGVAAAIGPLLALAGTILPAIGAGFALLTGPIGLVIAGITAIGVIIYKNWEPIKKTLVDIANYFVDLYNESFAFKLVVETAINVFKTLFEVGKFAFEGLKSLLGALKDQFVDNFKSIGEIIKAVLTGNLKELPEIVKRATESSKTNFAALTDNLSTDWDNLMTGIEKVSNDTLDRITSKKKLTYFESNVDATGITDAVAKATQLGLQQGAAGGGKGFSTPDVTAVQGIQTQGYSFENANANLVEGLNEGGTAGVDALNTEQLKKAREEMRLFQEEAERMQAIGDAVGDGVANVFSSMANSIISSFGEAETGFERFAQSLAATVVQLIATYLAQSIAASIAGHTASGTATGPLAAFTTPAFVAQGIAGVFAAFASIPKFETGGIVGGNSRVGDKLLIRANSGELVLNDTQQKRLHAQLQAGGGVVQVPYIAETRLSGSDIKLSLKRQDKLDARNG